MCAFAGPSPLSTRKAVPEYENLPPTIKAFADDQLFRAHRLVHDMRHPRTGLYYDAYVTVGQASLPSSIAATGVGLIALCIGDYIGWEQSGPQRAVQTLRAINGELQGTLPRRDETTGFLAHFIDAETGARRWKSEFSTIDTALLVSGALFAREYFQGNKEIDRLATKLYTSVSWEAAVCNPEDGDIYLEIREGQGANPLAPYNEYSILANMARITTPGRRLWGRVYSPERLHLLPMQQVGPGRNIICETGNIPSSFVYQFPFYLVHEYTLSPVYQDLCGNIAYADRLDWTECHRAPTFVWGHGAGVTPLGHYRADAIGNNWESVVSPYIIAGFLPVYPQGIYDLYDIYRTFIPYDDPSLSTLGTEKSLRFQNTYRYGLNRFQLGARGVKPWYPQHTSVIDWSSMLYGLMAFKYGVDFFAAHNHVHHLSCAC